MTSAIRSVIIPVAGKGTRLRPVTSVLPKPLFPLAGCNDRVTCVLGVILTQVRSAGIRRVALIVSPGQEDMIARYLGSLDASARALLPDDVTMIAQTTARGFGHAVLCGRDFAGAEPFAVLLGDHVHVAAAGRPPCLEQVVEAFACAEGVAMIGVHEVGIDEVAKVGLVKGDAGNGRIYRCLDFVEKPDPATARQRLQTPGLGPDRFLGHCGIYAFDSEIFTYLEQDSHRPDASGEIELATAQTTLLRNYPDGYSLYKIEGSAYDMGTPSGYRKTLMAFADVEVP